MRYFYALIFIVFLSVSDSFAQKNLTLDEAVEIAFSNNPQINISKGDVNISIAQTKGAISYYLPQASLTASGSYNGIQAQENSPTEDYSSLLGTVTVSQLITDFGKTSNSISQTKRQEDVARANLKQIVSNIKYQVKQAYYTILSNMNVIDAREEAVELYKLYLSQAEIYLKNGIKTEVDVTNASVNLAQAEQDLLNSKYDLEDSKVAFESILGVDVFSEDYYIYGQKYDNIEYLTNVPIVKESLLELIDITYKNKPEIISQQYSIKASQAGLKSMYAQHYPQLLLSGSYSYQHAPGYSSGYDPVGNSWNAQVGINWDIFTGLRVTSEVEEARVSFMQSKLQLVDIRLKAKETTTTSYLSTQRDKKNIGLSYNLYKLSSEQLDQIQAQYRSGIADYLQLQDASYNYINSKINLLVAYYDYYISLSELENSVGE